MDILVLPLRWFGNELISHPWIALFPAVIFLLLYLRQRSRWAFFASLLWFMYTLYEFSMQLKLLCAGECNIRVDLLLVYPLLMIISTVALAIYLKQLINRQ